MKKMARLLTTATLAITVLATSGIALAAELPYGSAGALDDDSYILEEMLTYAILEYAATANMLQSWKLMAPFAVLQHR